MKISNEHVARLLEARLERIQRSQHTHRQPPTHRAQPDRAVFSSRSEDLRIGLNAARGGREAEEPRLSGLAQEVRAGRYRVPARNIADALLRDLLRD